MGCFLTLLMILMFQTDQHEKLFDIFYFITVSERRGIDCVFQNPVPQTITLDVCAQKLWKLSEKEFDFIKVTCLQSGTLLEIKLLNKYFPIASSTSTSIYFVEHLFGGSFCLWYQTKNVNVSRRKYIFELKIARNKLGWL